jgi:hypothetical protein
MLKVISVWGEDPDKGAANLEKALQAKGVHHVQQLSVTQQLDPGSVGSKHAVQMLVYTAVYHESDVREVPEVAEAK